MSDVAPTLPAVGLLHTETMWVEPRHTVSQVADWPGFSDMPPVFATAMMVGFMEQTCIMALRGHLAAGQGTVGTHVDMSHLAATPVGHTVTATVELVAVEGRQLRFKVECRDDAEVIGRGVHDRFIIDSARFAAKAAGKAATPGR